MGFKLIEVSEGSQIVLHITDKEKHTMEMNASIREFLRDDVVVLELEYPCEKRISFEHVVVDMEYCFEGVMPILWRKVKIVPYKDVYIMQASSEGMRHNRRDAFRVGVGLYAQFRRSGHGTQQILLRDISISGFSITDKSKELRFENGDKVFVSFNDLGFHFDLQGKVVRKEEHEHMDIYGLELCNLCKGLSTYVNAKQRLKNQT